MANVKGGDEGGLMYKQLRKFINVIVSATLILSLIFSYLCRMNFVMWVCSSTSSSLVLQCSAVNLRVNRPCSSRSSVSTCCQEEMVSAPEDHWSCVSTTCKTRAKPGLSLTKCPTRSSLTSLRSRPLSNS